MSAFVSDAIEIKAIREWVNASQAVLARYLNVSTKLVQAWEAGRRSPEGAALKLLRIGGDNPKVVFAGAIRKNLKAGKLYMVRRRKPVGKRPLLARRKHRGKADA